MTREQGSLPQGRTITVICRRNGADTGVFTDGRAYTATQANTVSERLFRVSDDRGNERFIIPGERCPHLVRRLAPGYPRGFERQECVGVFEEVAL